MQNWPLVGRSEELSYVAELLALETSKGVFLAGPAGVGKTRFMAEVVNGLETHHVERVIATRSAQELPFGAVAHLMPATMPEDRLDVLAAVGRTLVARAEGRPIVLAVDDADLLDPMSAAFIHYAATSSLATVMVTVRSGQTSPDAIASLYRDGLLPRVELQPISRPEFDELIGAVLTGQVETATLDRLWDIADGNVLYVRELILDALEAGTLSETDGVWRWTGRAGTAPRLRELVFDRIGQLPAGQRAMLDLLAIAEPLGVALLEQLAPNSSLAEAERQGLIMVGADGQRVEARLGHPLFGEALRLSLPTVERRRIQHSLAAALQATGTNRRDDDLRVALWRMEAGDPGDSAMLTKAARLAFGYADFELAERLARQATIVGDGFDARLQLGMALSELGRHLEAEALLNQLRGTGPHSDAELGSLTDALVTAVGYGQGRVDDALQILIETEATVGDPRVRSLLQAHRATLLAFSARFGEAVAIGEAALATVDDEATRVRALTSVGISLVMAGKIDRAIALNDEMLPIAFQLQDRLPRAPRWVVTNRCTAQLLAGRFDEAANLIEFALTSIQGGNLVARLWASAYQARIALAVGKPATAKRLLDEVVGGPAQRVADVPSSWCLALHAEAHALLGNRAAARASAERASDATEPGYLAWDADARRALAWVSVAERRPSEAITQFLEVAKLARERGQTIFELLALSDALRVGEHRLAQRTANLATQIDGPWAEAIGLHAAALLQTDDPGLLEVAASAYETMASPLVAAELLAQASVSYGQLSLRARSTQTLRRSHALLQQCEGAQTHQPAHAADLVPLTRREHEVATRASQGETNAEIASLLYLSIRTVESHLHSAFAKLGVTDRRDLAEALS